MTEEYAEEIAGMRNYYCINDDADVINISL